MSRTDEEGAGERDRAGDEEERQRTETPGLGSAQARRFPGWLLLPLGGLAGWAVSGWAGAILGAVVGTLVWRTRA